LRHSGFGQKYERLHLFYFHPEVYRSADLAARHQGTTHYQNWRDAVVDMMEEPRFGVQYNTDDELAWILAQAL
jgi:quinol monooxygenase YgiN